jgi:pyruvate/2-oxoglutarate dehydrogenase complex dihydrolipoamide acyltransferase (E2) component
MPLGLLLPRIMEPMTVARIEAVHAAAGAALKPGDRLFDLTIDLGGSFLQNCPPISHFRLVLRERAILRRLNVNPGDDVEPGGCLAVFTTLPEEPEDGPMVRPLRIAVAGIIAQPGFWSARPAD